jgi:hypothetical protein
MCVGIVLHMGPWVWKQKFNNLPEKWEYETFISTPKDPWVFGCKTTQNYPFWKMVL